MLLLLMSLLLLLQVLVPNRMVRCCGGAIEKNGTDVSRKAKRERGRRSQDKKGVFLKPKAGKKNARHITGDTPRGR